MNAGSRQRPDIQGLRMVAVLLVVADHLFGSPSGGFVGVDVFFVVSGFLITGSLLVRVDSGKPMLWWFYRRRIRRIVPAAILVLIATVLAGYFVLAASSYDSLRVDALWSLLFAANWRFAQTGTDYFGALEAPSALQHFWSLAVEEQFYVVWPALMLVTALVAARLGRPAAVRMGVVVAVGAASFAYAVVVTRTDPTWAYFSTFTRAWELCLGAALAIAAPACARLPKSWTSVLAWVGLAAVAAGVVLSSGSGAFDPVRLAVPVAGTALILAAGVAGTPRWLYPLTNPVSVYIGDISYSLYLWHFPVIVLLGYLIGTGTAYYLAALALMFGLSIAAYHLVEDPIRRSSWLEPRGDGEKRQLRIRLPRTTVVAVGGAVALVVAGSIVAAANRGGNATVPIASSAPSGLTFQIDGDAGRALADEITAAAAATEWPDLDPTMDEAISGPQAPSDIADCGQMPPPPAAQCTWGSDDAAKTMVVVGDSVAVTYEGSLRSVAVGSDGDWRFHAAAAFGCRFITQTVLGPNAGMAAACPHEKQAIVEMLQTTKPDVVVITNSYRQAWNADTNRLMTPEDWVAGMRELVAKFSDDVGKIVFLSPPPLSADVLKCYSKVAAPAACLGGIDPYWTSFAEAEQRLAHEIGATFIDSRPWFCTESGQCPSFVGTTPVKLDQVHMTPSYSEKIAPAIAATLEAAGVL